MSDNKETYQFSPFWPVFLSIISLCLVLGWNLFISVAQRQQAIRVRDQQATLVAQSLQAEERLKFLLIDLFELSKTDSVADEIVRKYKISYNPATAGATAPVPLAVPALTNAPPVVK